MVPRCFLAVAFLFPLGLLHGQPPGEPLRKLAFGSCANQNKPQPIWNAIAALRPDAFVFLGDNIYADTEDMETMKAKYEKLSAQPGLKRLRGQCKIFGTWDDHDYGLNDAGIEYSKKKESQQLFLDFFGVPADSPRRQQEGIYAAELFGPPGKRVQLILLDTRYFRSPLKKRDGSNNWPAAEGPYVPNADPAATLLGDAQWKWLEEQLKVPAELRIIASSIQVVPEDHGWEKWMNLPRERERLFKLLKETKAGGVIFLSGDRHLAEISMMDAGLGFPLYDVTSSGMTEAAKRWRPLEPNRHRLGTMNFGDNFGLIAIDWEKPDPVVSLQIRDVEGDVRLSQKVPLSTLNPYQTKTVAAAAEPAPEGTVSLADAVNHAGKTVTVQFKVQATGSSGARFFLNSEANFRDDKNFTVVIDRNMLDQLAAAKKIEDPKSYFLGKTLKVTGKVEIFQNKAQIKLDAPGSLSVVENPAP